VEVVVHIRVDVSVEIVDICNEEITPIVAVLDEMIGRCHVTHN
jgi:hypothetical protein